mmetsp:Transcript_28376/g.94207  ORF Transcript_28376/g.94207 Transcript_28376/m.94207 type:complete len:273 (+) Transcript_28376:253-1071(+)|eukprot:CAMPEP_0203918784 /NCGR_PEP_ID=MMETSP0359-20131031/59289_1 /ASSEMBLY_ACC=CAM_ASM_000338 /TAXON_ID=268821 /ORGANISM="Scrippsiella Hangoei, Strain SHTV-5" /LENGTH=272 /DNA_ID=CAMNT_0050845951 /DNA_START=213 /DNA_END=1031 /DNA_ORIENTATION=+
MFSGFFFRGCTVEKGSGCCAPERATDSASGSGGTSSGAPSIRTGGMCSNLATCRDCAGGNIEPATLHRESQVPVKPPRKPDAGSDGPRLTVPHVFARFQFSVIYTQLGATQGTLMDQQRSMLQRILKSFTKELTSGFVIMSVMANDGSLLEHACSLDQDLTMLYMKSVDSAFGAAAAVAAAAAGKQPGPDAGGGCGYKALVFREIERISSPEEVRNLRIDNLILIDECCTTVVLAGQRCVTFRLESVAAREYLMLCLQVLRMSQDKARMWYP